MPEMRVLATGLEFPEGPVVMPDGSVLLVEIRGRRLTRVYPDGRKQVVAEIPGGPNGAAMGPDGKCYICNNGGFSWIPSRGTMMPGAPAPVTKPCDARLTPRPARCCSTRPRCTFARSTAFRPLCTTLYGPDRRQHASATCNQTI